MPYTGIVLAIVALHLAAFLILFGHWLTLTGLFPKTVEACAGRYETRPVRTTLVGILTFGPVLVLLLNASNLGNPVVQLFVIFVGAVALLLSFLGSAGLALRIGRNLSEGADPWAQARRGSVVLGLVMITPALGSLFLGPIGLASGFGAFLLARPWKKKSPPPEVSQPDDGTPPADMSNPTPPPAQ